MDGIDAEIANIVKAYRLLREFTQMELARLLGYDGPQFISLFERGLSKVPVETLGKLIVILEIPEAKIVKILIASFMGKMNSEIEAGKKKARLAE